MGLEIATNLNDLNPLFPLATDARSEGDDHIRMLKVCLQTVFPGLAGRFGRVQSKAAGYTLTVTDNQTMLNCTAGLTLAGLAAATAGNGFGFWIYANGGAVVFDPAGAELVNGAATATVADGNMALVVCTGTAWVLLNFAGSGLTASEVANVPAGSVVATDMQAAINELDTEKAALSGATFTGLVNLKTGANIASATTIDLSAATGNLVHITGTTATSAVTMTAGQWMRCIANNVWPLIYHATTNRISGGADYTCASNDVIDYFYDGTTVYGHITKADGTPVGASAFQATNGIQTYNTSQTLTTAHKGKYVYIYGTGTVTLTLPAASSFAAGGSLLLANSQQSGAGTTTVTRAGTDVIFAKGSGALNTIALGFGDSVWLVSNGVDQWIAVAEASHIGIGQTWQSVTRTHGTTYYNNTGKPIVLSAASITGNGTHIITVGGVQVAQSTDAAGNGVPISAIIPPNGTSYVVSGTGTETWVELR